MKDQIRLQEVLTRNDEKDMSDATRKILNDLTSTREGLLDNGAANVSSFYKCSDEDICEVEVDAGRSLPAAYLEFLKVMGRGAGRFFEGTDLFYPTMLRNTEAAHEMLKELANDLTLPEGSFVFAMHQGYQFFFFYHEVDNPAVY